MDVFTRDLATLKNFLTGKGVPADFSLPPRLAATPLKGGATLSWQGKPVSMVCFDPGQGETLYLFVLAENKQQTPDIEKVKGLSTATWSDGGKVFILAGRLPPAQIAELARL